MARGKSSVVSTAMVPESQEDSTPEGWGVDAELGLDEDGLGADEEREIAASGEPEGKWCVLVYCIYVCVGCLLNLEAEECRRENMWSGHCVNGFTLMHLLLLQCMHYVCSAVVF